MLLFSFFGLSFLLRELLFPFEDKVALAVADENKFLLGHGLFIEANLAEVPSQTIEKDKTSPVIDQDHVVGEECDKVVIATLDSLLR